MPPVRSKNPEKAKASVVMIELSNAQVNQIVRSELETVDMSLQVGVRHYQSLLARADAESGRLSTSLLTGLLVFASLPSDGGELKVIELARQLQLNVSTVHRYLTTLLEAGLVERSSATRRYRRAR
jgi:DNA-binding transcriptional ArsR family regulator